jgi:hypothetical protein
LSQAFDELIEHRPVIVEIFQQRQGEGYLWIGNASRKKTVAEELLCLLVFPIRLTSAVADLGTMYAVERYEVKFEPFLAGI